MRSPARINVGPSVIISYIDDLPNASNLLKIILFADDTCLFYSHIDPNQAISVMKLQGNGLA